MVKSGTSRRASLWRRAFAGLTPSVVAFVAVLLLVRMVSATVESFRVSFQAHELGTWFLSIFVGWSMLLVMALPMLLGVPAVANLGPQRGPKRLAALAAAVAVTAALGLLLRLTVASKFALGTAWDHAPGFLSYLWPRYTLLGGMVTLAAEFYRRQVASVDATRRALLETAALGREMAEARLQVLQAQIEPHFLFNTLANVRRLYSTDHAAGRAMLENFMRYLEVALPRIRSGTSTLGSDAELVEAFMRVHQIRMGTRLEYDVDVPRSLHAVPVPPMMVLTLVENAIKHGVNPLERGGLVRFGARTEGETLIVSVADTGIGFAPGSGAGAGLANIRARLSAQFGARASLTLENNEFGGATAILALPMTGGVA